MTRSNSPFASVEIKESGYYKNSRASYELMKMGINVESFEGSAACVVSSAFGGYNQAMEDDFAVGFMSTQTEADNPTDSPKSPVAKQAFKDKAVNSVKNNAKKFSAVASDKMKNFAADAKKFAAKAKGFAESSVAKANTMPEETFNKAVEEKIVNAREDPKSMQKLGEDAIKNAGKAVAIGGLATVSLPIAAAAFVANKAFNNQVKKQSLRDIEAAQIKLDAEMQKADQAGDIDRKADLLIAKRQFERAHNKIKFGLSETEHPNFN